MPMEISNTLFERAKASICCQLSHKSNRVLFILIGILFRPILLFFLLLGTLFSEEFSHLFILESDPAALVAGVVNALTGDPSIRQTDLVIQGAEPIPIVRSYINWKDLNHQGECKWAICEVIAKCEKTPGCEYRFTLTEKEGCPVLFKRGETVKVGTEMFTRYNLSVLNGRFSNTSRSVISSRTNLRNSYVLLDSKEKFLFHHSADGSVREYKKIPHSEGEYRLLSEHLPNGHWVLYDYLEETKDGKPYFRLASIQTTNPSKTKLFARADFTYESTIDQNLCFSIRGSDGQSIRYQFGGGSLELISSSSHPDCKLSWRKYKTIWPKEKRLDSIQLPQERTLQFDYYREDTQVVAGQTIKMVDEDLTHSNGKPDPRRSRVKTISAPVGKDAKLYVTHTFLYDPKSHTTSVYDIEGNRTDYIGNNWLQLKRIERYAKTGEFVGGEAFCWSFDTDCGNLLCKTSLNADRTPIVSKGYTYDPMGNVLSETLYGNLSGLGPPLLLGGDNTPMSNGVETCIKRYRYSDNYPSLPIEEIEENGKRTTYEYLPGTDLLVTECLYNREQLQSKKIFEYNEDHLLTAIVEEEKITHFILLETGPYIGLPSIIEERSPEGLLKKTVLTYTDGARIARKDIYDATNTLCYSLHSTYDAKGRLVAQTDPLGRIETFSYDECNNLISHTAQRVTTKTTYDCSNRPILEQVQGDDGIFLETRFSYDLKGHKISAEKPFGLTTSYTYDSAGNLSEECSPPFFFKTISDALGRPILRTDPLGYTTKTTYSAHHKPIQIEHPDGGIEQFTYYRDGSLHTATDPNGTSTTYTYDYLGRILSKQIAFLSKETFEYTPKHLLSQTDPEGHQTTYTYDKAGRLYSKKKGDLLTEFQYDALGRQTIQKEGDLLTCQSYDLLDHLIAKTEQSVAGELFTKTLYEYDEASNLTSTTRFIDSQSSVEQTVYDSLQRPIRHINPLGHTTHISYEHLSKGLQKTITNPLGLQTIELYNPHHQLIRVTTQKQIPLRVEEFSRDFRGNPLLHTSEIFAPAQIFSLHRTYDALGRLLTITENSQRTTIHTYDRAGHLLSTEKPNRVILSFHYDPLGRVTELTSSDGTIHYTYTYNRLGELLQSTDLLTHQTTQKSYTPHGDLLTETLGNGLTLHSTYDARRRRTTLTLPDQSSIQYTYDPFHLRSITRRSHFQTYTHTIDQYDLSDRPVRETLPFSLGTLTRSYTPQGALNHISSPYLTHTVSERDLLGNILQATLNSQTTTYRYDPLSQLLSEQGPYPHTYTHDAHHARLSTDQTAYKTSPFFQHSHLDYDLNGNPTQSSTAHYTFDALDRLTQIQTPTHRITNTYDSEHRRLTKTIHHFSSDTTQTLLFLYDGPYEIGSTTSDHTLQEFRLLSPLYSSETGAAVALELNHRLYIPFHDLYGNTALLLNSDGTIALTHHYSAFTQEFPPTTFWLKLIPSPTNPWRYASKRIDDETNLINYGQRYYAPSLGRWLTPDPAGYTTLNRYTFLQNNPLNRADDFGLLDFGQYDSSYQHPDIDYSIGFLHSLIDSAIGTAQTLLFPYEFGFQSPHSASSLLGKAQTFIHTQVSPSDPTSFGYRSGYISAYLVPFAFESLASKVFPLARCVESSLVSRTAQVKKSCLAISRQNASNTTLSTKHLPKLEELWFGQSSVSSRFSLKGNWKGAPIREVAEKLRIGEISPDELPIEYIVRNGKKITLNNRSVLAFHRAKKEPTVLIDKTNEQLYEDILNQHLKGNDPSSTIKIRGGPYGTSWIGN